MSINLQNLSEQEQLNLLADKESTFQRVLESYENTLEELGLNWAQEFAARYIDSDEEVPEDYAATLSNADDALKAKLRAFKLVAVPRWDAIEALVEIRKALRNSEYESVREAAWADVDKQIAEIETGRFHGQYLQNILYALSIGPFSSSDQKGDVRIRFQTGDYEHYNLPDLLNTYWLIGSSDIYGEFGARGSILTENGKEVLKRLTMKYGEPDWSKKLQQSSIADALKGSQITAQLG